MSKELSKLNLTSSKVATAGTAVGVFIAQGPPVPIPNTEVKLCGAENTCLATSWEDRSMPTPDKHRGTRRNTEFEMLKR